ncbi:MAG: hypothetical protein V6Z86_08010 [Hyphomicrobiales bacterium]
MENWSRSRSVFWILNLPGTCWLIGFFLAPLGLIWGLSFGEKTSIADVAITGTFAHYARALQPVYLGVIWNRSGLARWRQCFAFFSPTRRHSSYRRPQSDGSPFSCLRWSCRSGPIPFALIYTYALIMIFRQRGFVNFALG